MLSRKYTEEESHTSDQFFQLSKSADGARIWTGRIGEGRCAGVADGLGRGDRNFQ